MAMYQRPTPKYPSLALCVALAGLLVLGLWLAVTPVTAQNVGCVIDDGVNIRSGPSLAFGAIGQAFEDECLAVLACEDNGDPDGYRYWVETERGWINSELIALNDPLCFFAPQATPTRTRTPFPTPTREFLILPTSTPPPTVAAVTPVATGNLVLPEPVVAREYVIRFSFEVYRMDTEEEATR